VSVQHSPDPYGGDELNAQNPSNGFHWASIQVGTRNLPLLPDTVDRIRVGGLFLHVEILYMKLKISATRQHGVFIIPNGKVSRGPVQ
jgi:hypothetical protein